MSRLLSMVFAGVVVVGGLAGTVRAENWPDTLFSERSHDFGPVPRGGIVRHPFVLTNRLQEPSRSSIAGLVWLHQRDGEHPRWSRRARRRSSRPRWTRGTSSAGSRPPCSSRDGGARSREIGLGSRR